MYSKLAPNWLASRNPSCRIAGVLRVNAPMFEHQRNRFPSETFHLAVPVRCRTCFTSATAATKSARPRYGRWSSLGSFESLQSLTWESISTPDSPTLSQKTFRISSAKDSRAEADSRGLKVHRESFSPL